MTRSRKQRHTPEPPSVEPAQHWSPGWITSRDDFIEASVYNPKKNQPCELITSISRQNLIAFLRLRDATAPQIAEYARQHGILGTFEADEGTPQVYVETASGWRETARAFESAINITMQIDKGLPVTTELWRHLRPYLIHHEELRRPLRSTPTKNRERIAGAINAMLKQANVGPVLTWSANHWSVEIAGRQTVGIYGGLVLRLTELIVGANQFGVCSHCAHVYIPTRKPPVGSRNFCPQCRDKGVPLLYAKRDELKRKEQRSGKES